MKSLFGYGLTTREIAKSGGWEIYDDSFTEAGFDRYGNILFPSRCFDENKSSLEITSPGIPPSNPLIKKAKNLISEFDYFYETAPFQIWVTGTNGKTTTTEMIHFLLKNSDIGGNIGIPLAKMDKKRKFWIIEASSFQLYYTKYAKPDIFIVLPVKEDHISWHGCFENYIKAKLSPLERMSERDIVIMPKMFDTPTKAFKILYENENDLINYFNFKKFEFQKPFLLDEIMAKAVYYILYFKEKTLKNFKTAPHKLEELKDCKNRIWIDDSKATNTDAALNALKRYKDKKIYLILGGVNKGQNFEELFKFMQNLDIEIFIIGEKRDLFINLAKKYKIPFYDVKSIEKAVNLSDKKHNQSSIVLLSPACASFDQFKSYKDRGEIFKEKVKNLKLK